MSQAIEAYRGITATEEFKYLEHLRSKARHDEAQAIRNAALRGEKLGAEAERGKWLSVVDTEREERQKLAEENERLRQELAELRLRN